MPTTHLDIERLRSLEAEGILRSQRHPSRDLFVWNYSDAYNFKPPEEWCYEARICRGLVTDSTGRVKARPFAKFWNLSQHKGSLPSGSFEVYQKLDGSLIIAFWDNDGELIVLSRGSFTSPQAKKAEWMLRRVMDMGLFTLPRYLTACFEVIYPENRVVVDYGDAEDLYLLALIHTETGQEWGLRNIGTPIVGRYDFTNIHELPQNDNEEGWVVKFENGLRLKVKNAEYLRLHRLLTGFSAKHIWEILAAGQSLDGILDRVPDEFYAWVRETAGDLQTRYACTLALARLHLHLALVRYPRPNFKHRPLTNGEIAQYDQEMKAWRKAVAAFLQKSPANIRPIIFALLDEKDPAPIIWKQLKPTGEPYAFRQKEAA